jgi:MGT family glycosyltransferase
MAHFGFVVPPYVGHMNPSLALARALVRRGHRLTLLTVADGLPLLRTGGFEGQVFGRDAFPEGAWNREAAVMGGLQGLAASKHAIQILGARMAGAILGEFPELLPKLELDGLIMDQVCPGADCVAALLQLPLAVACNAFPLHMDPDVPPYYLAGPYQPTAWRRFRNRLAYLRMMLHCRGVFGMLVRFRRRHRLPLPRWNGFNEISPSLVQVSQVPAWLDYPRRQLPDHFHYTGPWHERVESQRDGFPWERLDGRPLIYAAIGTLQNRIASVYGAIAEACAQVDAQLVLALGRNDGSPLPAFPGSPLVVGYAPQQALMARCRLAITHAGLNSALEALRLGAPMIAIPIANEQPAIASRLDRLRLAKVLPVARLEVARLRAAILELLNDSAARERAQEAARKLETVSGQDQAAALVEQAFGSRKRVLREATERGRPRGPGREGRACDRIGGLA